MNSTADIFSGAVSERGLSDKRPENEDAYLEAPEYGIFAVADGVGGAQAGDVASQMAVEILSEAFINLRPGTDPESVMLAAIEKANASIYQMSRDLPQLSSMATTVVALHLNGNIATIGHVGDSRLYRVDREGNFFRETDDHSMVAEEVRAGRMTEAQAENHPSRNIISRALGAEDHVSVDTKTVMIDRGTAFLLCSDGITRHVSDQEIRGVLTFGGSPADICAYLKDLCYHRGAEDNLTAVVVKTGTAISNGVPLTHTFDVDETLQAYDLEETTVSSTRSALPTVPSIDPDDQDLLELSTDEPRLGGPPSHVTTTSKQSSTDIESIGASETPAAPQGVVFRIEPPPSKEEPHTVSAHTSDEPTFTIFGSSETVENGRTNKLGSKVLSALAFLVLGAILGIGVYYLVSPEPVDTDGPLLTEMRSANIPLSAFEVNRRNVDKDPAGYVARFGTSPQDCEDYYLLARAYLLTGDYVNARNALIEARSRLSEADPSNAGVLASDIAIAMSVTNGTTVQSMLKKELEWSKPMNSNSVANASQ